MSLLDAVLDTFEGKVPLNPTVIQPVAVRPVAIEDVPEVDHTPANRRLYRGLAHPIKGNTLDAILTEAQLNWKVAEVPVLMQGKGENRVFPNKKALVRCDTGAGLDITSDRFKVHQNAEIVAGLSEIADLGDIKLTHGGSTDGGAQIFLHGTVGKTFELPVGPATTESYYGGQWGTGRDAVNKHGQRKGDIVRLDFRMSGGHRPGCPTRVSAMAMRLACLNGAVLGASEMSVTVTHRQKFSASHLERIQQMVRNAAEAFGGYERKARTMIATPFTHGLTRAFVIEALQPDLLRVVADKTTANGLGQRMSNSELLSHILEHSAIMDRIERGNTGDDTLALGRATKQVLGLVDTQPGAELHAGTAWTAYNALTYYADHVRGRGEVDAAVESAISGESAKIKARALDLAVEYAERIAAF